MKRRYCLWQFAPLLLALFVSGTAAWSVPLPTGSDTATVGLTVDQFVDVSAPDAIYDWGQGVLDNGVPNYALNGAAPEFVGGSTSDMWPHDGMVLYCHGAVGRTTVVVSANCQVEVGVMEGPENEYPELLNGSGGVLQARALLGWDHGSGNILAGRERDIVLHGTDTSTWFYMMVKRSGIDDEAGLYSTVVWLEAFVL